MKTLIIRRRERHTYDVIDQGSGTIQFTGYGALGRGWDKCEQWLADNGYVETTRVGEWQPSPFAQPKQTI